MTCLLRFLQAMRVSQSFLVLNDFDTFENHAYMLSRFSRVQLCATLWTIAHQAPLSMGFSRQKYCSGLPCPSPGDLPEPGVKPASLMSPELARGFFTTSTIWEAQIWVYQIDSCTVILIHKSTCKFYSLRDKPFHLHAQKQTVTHSNTQKSVIFHQLERGESESEVSHSVVSDSCDPMEYSLPGSSVHGISQARILEWIAMPFSRGSSQPRNRT